MTLNQGQRHSTRARPETNDTQATIDVNPRITRFWLKFRDRG